MPNNHKIVGELETVARELSSKNTTLTKGGKVLGVSRETYKKWLLKNNLSLPVRVSIHQDKIEAFIKICKEAIQNNTKIKLNSVLKELGLRQGRGQKTINKNNLRAAIRTKQQAAVEDRTLSLEEAQSRLPNQRDKIIGFKDSKYEIVSPDGFIYYKKSAKIQQGNPRGKCGGRLSIEYIESKLKEHNYVLIKKSYTIKRESLKATHEKCGNVRENRFANFFDQDCPTCSNTGVSKVEEEVNKWIQSFDIYTEKFRFKGKTKGKEIDIYIPSLNLGIEYCGLYWHSEHSPHPKDNKYHQNKMKQCNEQGIRLITIFEDEWRDRNSQLKSFLKSIIGKAGRRFFARKCVVKEVEKLVAKDFLEKYHIQGKTVFKIVFGLYLDDELLGLVSGNCHHRQKGENTPFVLNRLVFKEDVVVVGGASRLIKHLVRYAKKNKYRQLISWSDNRFSEGNVYEKCGFVLEQHLGPDYSYVVGTTGTRSSKQSNKKKLLLKKGAIGSMEENTEREMALSLDMYRIWDCGKKRWAIDL